MFKEDSQIDFAKENVILNVSLRPSLPPGCTFHFSFHSVCVNYLLKIRVKSSLSQWACVIQTAFIGDRERDFSD